MTTSEFHIKGTITRIERKKTKKGDEFAVIHVSDKDSYFVMLAFKSVLQDLKEGLEIDAFGVIKGQKCNSGAYHNLIVKHCSVSYPKKSWSGRNDTQAETITDGKNDEEVIEDFGIPAEEEVGDI